MYYAALDFTLPFSGFAMEAFNLTARVRVEDESSLAAMGLLIASRMVDRLQLGRLADNRLQLSLRKEKSYPRVTVQGAGSPPALGQEFLVVAPAPEELKFLVGESLGRTAPALLPPEFYYPGKVVDMVAPGDYRAAIVRDGVGRIGGGILWRWSSERMVECCGPYLLAEAEDNSAAAKSRRRMLAEDLLEHCLNRIAKSPAVGLVNLYPSSDLPAGHFESLGAIFEYRSTAPPVERGALFRQLQEDPGALVWGHPQLEDFLRGEYRRLVLPRELRLTADDGEDRAAALYPSGDAYHLRRALGEKFNLDPEQFLVGNGANEVIAFVIKAFCHDSSAVERHLGLSQVDGRRGHGAQHDRFSFSQLDSRQHRLLGGDDGFCRRFEDYNKSLWFTLKVKGVATKRFF